MSLGAACTVCDARIDPCGRDGTRCARCNEPCTTCGGDVAYCQHPLQQPLDAAIDLTLAARGWKETPRLCA